MSSRWPTPSVGERTPRLHPLLPTQWPLRPQNFVTLRTTERVQFQTDVHCDDLTDILSAIVTGRSVHISNIQTSFVVTGRSVLISNMQTAFFPTKDGESYTPEQLKQINRSKRQIIACAKRFTDELIAIIKSSPGPVCLIIRGLDGFSCHVDRILSFLCRPRRLCCIPGSMLLIGEREPLPKNRAGLKVSWCLSGFHFVLFSSDELLAGTSDTVKMVKKAWNNKRQNKTTSDEVAGNLPRLTRRGAKL